MNRVQMHKELCGKLNDIYARKNSDYGNSFGETFEKLGVISAITRISDKYNRLVSLCTKPEEERKVKDESIEDTLLDLANYAIMTVIEMRKKDEENTKKDEDISCNHEWQMYEYWDEINNEMVHRCQCNKCGEPYSIE